MTDWVGDDPEKILKEGFRIKGLRWGEKIWEITTKTANAAGKFSIEVKTLEKTIRSTIWDIEITKFSASCTPYFKSWIVAVVIDFRASMESKCLNSLCLWSMVRGGLDIYLIYLHLWILLQVKVYQLKPVMVPKMFHR